MFARIGMALLCVFFLCVHSETTTAQTLGQKLEPLLHSHQGEIAVAVKNLKTGESFQYRAEVPQPTASLIKLPIMIAAYQRAEQNEVSLDQPIVLKKEDFVPGSGILTQHFSAGTSLSLRDAIRLMIVYSDNTATNLVLQAIDLPTTNQLMEKLHLKETKIHSLVYRRDTSILPDRSQKYGLGSTTAAEMIQLLELLETGKVGSEDSIQAMKAHLVACDDHSKLNRDFPKEVKFAHKTGAVNKVRCDAGILETSSGSIALCALTNENKDQSWGDSNEAELLCGEIGKIVLDHFNKSATSTNTSGIARPLKVGASGPLVEALQRTLNARSEPSPKLMVDGDFGPNTESAVIAFQKQMAIEATGVVTKETWDKLGPLEMADTSKDESPENTNPKLKSPRDALTGPPFVSCEAWAIADSKTGEILFAHAGSTRREPASTTKMMTALLACEYVEHHPEALDEWITFSSAADLTPGSTSAIQQGEKVKLSDLFYGLLLPSGNDASIAIAEHLGKKLQPEFKGTAVQAFVAAMNARAQQLGLTGTQFENPHGLTSPKHYSTAVDLSRLAREVMQHERLRQVVSTRSYRCELESELGYRRMAHWENTNQLLDIEGFDGVKTGTTGPAGACLVSRGRRGDHEIIMVVLGATSSTGRYVDSRNLYRWAWNELGAQP